MQTRNGNAPAAPRLLCLFKSWTVPQMQTDFFLQAIRWAMNRGRTTRRNKFRRSQIRERAPKSQRSAYIYIERAVVLASIMTDTTFNVSPEVTKKRDREIVDNVGALRTALRRPIEQQWLPRNPVVACDDDHTLLTALCYERYMTTFPCALTPDALWITLARGFALHVNHNAEEHRHKFVSHSGRKKLR